MTPQKRETRRRRIVLSQSQKDTLWAWFEKNPYPDLAARESLAREIGISESQILTWFQNHRRLKRLESKHSFRENQPQRQDKVQFKTQAKQARRTRTHFTRCQTSILMHAFNKNRFPGIATRETLARQTGIPESRIQTWFQNRRSRHPGQSRGGPVASLVKGPNESPPESDQPAQSSQCTALDNTAHLSPAKASTTTLSAEPALSLSNTDSVPLESLEGCERQLPMAVVVQPSPAVWGKGVSRPSTLTGHLSTEMNSGGESSHTQPPFCPPIKGGCGSSEHRGLVMLPLRDSAQPLPGNQPLQELQHQDKYFFLRCWDEWFQSFIAEWEPENGYWSPGQTEIQVQGQSPENASQLSERSQQHEV